MNDATLHETARRLGREAAERLDVDATARAVVERLRREPAGRPGWRAPAWLRIAAAAAVLAGGALVVRQALVPDGGTGETVYVAADLAELSVGELEAVLATLDETLDGDTLGVTDPGLETLDTDELSAVLRSLEG